MEEAVTRKFVHEESCSVTSLCATVEACLSQGLRRRALGLFKTSSTTALLHKVAKHCPEAQYISKRVLDIEHSDPNKRSSSSSDSTSKPPILKKNSSTSITNNSPTQPVVKWVILHSSGCSKYNTYLSYTTAHHIRRLRCWVEAVWIFCQRHVYV